LGAAATIWTNLWIVLLVFWPALWPNGHLEDVIAITFVMLAVHAALRGRSDAGAVLFSLAIAAKQWTALAVPIFLVMLPRRVRWRAALLTVALPAALAAFVLLVDFRHASYSLLQG